jgi:hypothetical protein
MLGRRRTSECSHPCAGRADYAAMPRWCPSGVKTPAAVNQVLDIFVVFGLDKPKIESRRADSNRLPNLITSDDSGVAEVCTRLQTPHS